MKDNNDIIKNFYTKLDAQGYKGKIISAKYLPKLRHDVIKHHQEKQINPEFYEEYKSLFEFKPDVDFPQINSLFIISVPVPQYEAIFHWNGKNISLLIPPTYLYGRKIIDQILLLVNGLLEPRGYKASYAYLPQKTLAVRSGLAEYGRNNISYVQGMGSFHRLTTLYSDFPFEQDNWQELRTMEVCKECSACIRKCPSGAIADDRFLLHVERCLTFHNEHPGGVPFPEWIDPEWHNCVVGCLICQKVCPANKKVKQWIEPGPEFSEEETKMILKGYKFDALPIEVREKVEKFDLVNYYEVLPRNLKNFFR